MASKNLLGLLSFNQLMKQMEKVIEQQGPRKQPDEYRWLCECGHKNWHTRDFCGLCSKKKGAY